MAWEFYNPNPVSRSVGDCAVRAIAKALDVDWESAYVILSVNGFQMCDMMNANSVIGATLRQHEFYRAVIPDDMPDCYSASDFCRDNPEGLYVLGFGSHVATVRDGTIYDSWDCSNECPMYYWYKK